MKSLLMANKQPPERILYRDDGRLEVIEIFRTIQGEGPDAGTPAIFIRLAGCTLQCPSCDTNYTECRRWMKLLDICDRILELSEKRIRLVVITGGEPFRQDFTPLVKAMYNAGFRFNIETNGTIWDNRRFSFLGGTDESIKIICSPKYKPVDKGLADEVHSYKYVLAAGHTSELDGLPTRVLGANYDVFRHASFLDSTPEQIFVQPEDSGDPETNAANLAECVRTSMKYGYRICIQQHKLLGVP